MSTTVYNPFTFSEVSRIRAIGRRPPVDTTALARVRRDLFGPVNHEDTRKFVMRELAAQQSQSSGRWGFDFEREQPITDGPGSERYFWEKVTEVDTVPQAYSLHDYSFLTTSETITATAEDADVNAAAPTPPASPLEAASSTCPSTSSPEIETGKPTVPVKSIPSIKRTSILNKTTMKRRRDDSMQKKMTDFLRIRKSTSSLEGAKLRRLSGPIASSSPQSTS